MLASAAMVPAVILRNKRRTVIAALYAAVTIVVVASRAQQYADAETVWIPIARASAAGVYLNFALLMLPMMRLFLSRPFVDPLARVLPLHYAIESHIVAGIAALGFSLVHVVAYLGFALSDRELLLAIASPTALVTGVLLTAVLLALGYGAWARGRRSYEWFFYTHALSIPVGILSIFHAPLFLALVGIPLGAYLVDRILRVAWSTRAAEVVEATAEGRDVQLVLHRPQQFEYLAGDYAFLCVPSISRFEWHPFSLTSAPSDTGDLIFRIRRCGSWTEALGELRPGTAVLVDGPFGTPCRDLHRCRRAVIVAGGIGITPFVSFLEQTRTLETPSFERLHVIWCERDDASLAWYRPRLEALRDALGGALTLEIVSGKTIDWEEAFADLREEFEGATVFFCGSKPMSAAVRRAAFESGMDYRTESF